MRRWLVLPYDGSPLARATLRRAARAGPRPRGSSQTAGVLLVTAGIEAEALDGLLDEASTLAGPGIALRGYLLHPGDPLASLRRLLGCLPNAALAAPVSGKHAAPWCAAAWRLDGLAYTRVLFFITPRDMHAVSRGAFAHREGGRDRSLRRPRTSRIAEWVLREAGLLSTVNRWARRVATPSSR